LLFVFVDVECRGLIGHDRQGHGVTFDDVEHGRSRDEATLTERNPKRFWPRGGTIGAPCERGIQPDKNQDRACQERQRAPADSVQRRSRIGSRPTIDFPMEASAFVNRTT
jgi:hypothetical protein